MPHSLRSFALATLTGLALCGGVSAQNLAIVDAILYISPQSPPHSHTTLLIQKGKIAAIGQKVAIPQGTTLLPCDHCVVFAGFWNTHVHFTGAQWDQAAQADAGQLTRAMQAMLTHSGFTTVVDTASDPENTLALRRRVEAGEVLGPHIYSAGFGLYPPHGIPFYLDDLAPEERTKLPQPGTPAAAVAAVQRNQALGTDMVKLFTGSYLAPDHITRPLRY